MAHTPNDTGASRGVQYPVYKRVGNFFTPKNAKCDRNFVFLHSLTQGQRSQETTRPCGTT